MRENDYVLEARAKHHAALKAMMPADSTMSGVDVWRKLRRLECKGKALGLRLCNGPEVTEAEQERELAAIKAGVAKVFGRELPGFFVNLDPRGWALKLEPGSVPYKLHEDWGRYQILAPVIEGGAR